MAVVIACVISLGFSGITVYYFTHGKSTPEAIQKAVQEQGRQAARESVDALRDRVSVGVTRDYVEWMLGAPDNSHQIGNDDSVLELWEYDCRDGARVRISILDGKVQSITQ